MDTSTDPIVHDSEPERRGIAPWGTLPSGQVRVSWTDDPYADAELQRRTERTLSMIEKARRQLL